MKPCAVVWPAATRRPKKLWQIWLRLVIIRAMTILVVDDSPTQRARWLYALSGPNTTVISEEHNEGAGISGANVIRVVTAKNGEQALSRLRSMRVDVLIADVEMPGMNGWALAVAAQALKKDLQVIVFSAKVVTGQNGPAELNAGNTHVISKDDREQAVGLVRGWLDKNQA